MGTSPLRTASSTSVCLRTVLSCSVAGDCVSHPACCAMVWVGFQSVRVSSPEVHYPVREFATLAGGDWVHRIPRALAALGVGLYNPITCPRAADVQLQSPPGNIVTLRTAKLRHRDTCRLTVPHRTPWHGHHGPRHPFPDNDDPWPTAVR